MIRNFVKVNNALESGRYFSTVWCTLESKIIPTLQSVLLPLKKYCNWLSTFGDSQIDGKYQPHITLRYLGFTDELDRNKILADLDTFRKIIDSVSTTELELGKIVVWKRFFDKKVVSARLNWGIKNIDLLKNIHNELLEVGGYQFFNKLEGDKYDPHISLGEVILFDNNLENVEKYLSKTENGFIKVKLDKFAINYASESGREEFVL